MFDQTHIKLHKQRTMGRKYVSNTWIQAAEQAWYACARQTCLIRLSKRTKHEKRNVLRCLIECLTAFKFYQTRPNTIKQHQTRWPNGKMFGHQIFNLFIGCSLVTAESSNINGFNEVQVAGGLSRTTACINV